MLVPQSKKHSSKEKKTDLIVCYLEWERDKSAVCVASTIWQIVQNYKLKKAFLQTTHVPQSVTNIAV